MLAVGVPILTGTEKVIEAWLVAMSPECPRRSVARR
jgi:hypothetical protein